MTVFAMGSLYGEVFTMHRKDTVADLKERINHSSWHTPIPPENQRVFYKGDLLTEGVLPHDENVKLIVMQRTGPSLITEVLDEETDQGYMMDLDASDTVGLLKTIMQDIVHEEHAYRLVLTGHGIDASTGHNQTLGEFSLRAGDVNRLHLSRVVEDPINVMVKLRSGKSVTLTVQPYYQVELLKQLIRDVEGIEVVYQRLVYKGIEMEDWRTMAEYKLHNGSVVILMLRNR